MKKLFRIAALLLTFVFVFTAAGCGERVEETSVWVEGEDTQQIIQHSSGTSEVVGGNDAQNGDNSKNQNGNESKNQNNNNQPQSGGNAQAGNNQQSGGSDKVTEIDSDGRGTAEEVDTNTDGKKLDLKGADFTIASWGSSTGGPSPSSLTYSDEVKTISDIEKKYNCKIKFKAIPDSMTYLTSWTTAAQSGVKFADVVTLPSSGPYPSHMKEGYLVALDKYLDLNDAVFNKKANDAITYNNKHYVVVFSNRIKLPTGLIFNREVFRKMKLENQTPDVYVKQNNWNFDTFLELCKKLTKVEGGVQYYGFGGVSASEWATANGGVSVAKVNGKYKFAMNSSKYINGLQFAYDLVNTHNVSGGSFSKGTAAMAFGESYRGVDYMSAIGSENYGWTYIPHGPDVSDYQVTIDETTCYGVPATCKNPEIAANILYDYFYPYKWRTSYEKQNEKYFGDATSLKTALEMGRKANANMNLMPLYSYITRTISWGDYGISKKTSPQAYIESVSKAAQEELDVLWEQ